VAEVGRLERLRDRIAFLAGNGLIDHRLWWRAYAIEEGLVPWRRARDGRHPPPGGLPRLP
jgi:hypothetical protein